jgi:plastocyanin
VFTTFRALQGALNRPRILLLAALLGALTLAGCGQEPASPGAAATATTGTGSQTGMQEVVIIAKDDMFEPVSYTVTGNAPLRITARNDGQHVHEVEVKGLMPETKLTPGQSKSVDVQSVEPGTYRIYCEIHEDQGMEGELIVK